MHMSTLTSLIYLPPALAVEVIESEPCVCASVCLSVCLCALSQVNRLAYGQGILHGDLPGPYLGQLRWARS